MDTKLRENKAEQVFAYVGIKWCGHAVAAAVDRPEYRKDNAKETAKWIRAGLTLERWPVERVRTDFHACKCKYEQQVSKQSAERQGVEVR